MLIRCGECDYDRTGLPLDGRCPECGSRRAYLVRPRDWRWLLRPPGVLIPIGAALAGVGAVDLFTGMWLLGPLWDALLLLEGLLVMAAGAMRWD